MAEKLTPEMIAIKNALARMESWGKDLSENKSDKHHCAIASGIRIAETFLRDSLDQQGVEL